jgi:hypothetical protein
VQFAQLWAESVRQGSSIMITVTTLIYDRQLLQGKPTRIPMVPSMSPVPVRMLSRKLRSMLLLHISHANIDRLKREVHASLPIEGAYVVL